MAVCYRHPSRETGVSCSNCGRPICPDCMTPTQVGMRCPECSRERTQVRTLRNTYSRPVVTIALIAINVLIYFGSSTNAQVFNDYSLVGFNVADGEWYRLITAGFLHSGLIHLAFNMYILWFLGNLLEPSLGSVRFAGLYFASLLSGSLGALLLSFDARTVGASGAIYGLMGAAFVMQYARGVDPMQSGIGPLILLNLAISFVLPNISIGGHIGGLVGGAVAALLIDQSQKVRRGMVLPVVACVIVAAIAFAASIAFAQSQV